MATLITAVTTATNILFTPALQDTSSSEYETASRGILGVFQSGFERVAIERNARLVSTRVSFLNSSFFGRKKRSGIALSGFAQAEIVATYEKDRVEKSLKDGGKVNFVGITYFNFSPFKKIIKYHKI